ncbi:MAG: ABC transporter permease [Aestuariivirgaceae bacterium]
MLKRLLFATVHQLRLFLRRPAAMFFVIVMPVLLLVIFTAIFGNAEMAGQGITTAQLYTPTLAVFGAVLAAYTYLAIATATARDQGVLKRLRGTPLPPWIDIAGRIAAAGLIAIAAVVAVMACGMLLYSVKLLPEKLPAAILSLLVGISCFAALGMAVAALCRTAATAQAVANATILPVAFISDVFVRPDGRILPWIDRIADIFPLKHLSRAFSDGFKPLLAGNGFAFAGDATTYAIGQHLLVMALWGLGGAVIAFAFFRWETQRDGSRQ